jgi:gliding motility-associated-like protein
VKYFKTRDKKRKWLNNSLLQLSALVVSSLCFINGNTQNCPPNIDFETGTFDNWTCYTGFTSAVGNDNLISLASTSGPVSEKHTMYTATANAGELDPFGNFPVLCPNGSGNSIRLGSTTAGGEAEGVSYEFTIPANENNYSLIYHYAVVFQSPNHRTNEQPRMEIEVTNVTDNSRIDCSSFTFIAQGSSMPGFERSTATDTISILYKPWSAVSIDLSGKAGKTIRLFFKTADCTFRRHFGYAYIDVNSECTNSFIGADFCPDDTLVKVTAPFGYRSYAWYDSSLNRFLGNEQTVTLSPPPPSGSTIAVKVQPYDGFGCPSTLFTELKNTLTINPNAGKDGLSCNNAPVLLGANSKPGLQYQWSPPTGLSDAEISNPIAAPDSTTRYILTVNSPGGGCKVTDTVIVRAFVLDDSLEVLGKDVFCIDNGDSAVLKVQSTNNNIVWFKNNVAISGVNTPTYRVISSGTYHAVLKNAAGCSSTTDKKVIVIDKAKPGITYPVAYAIADLPLNLKARKIGEYVLWNPVTSLNNANSFIPVFTDAAEKLYTIEIKTATECITIDTQLVKIIKDVEIYVPTAFTPNRDGKNDLLRPHLRGIKELHYFKVFNRWGQLLFEKRNDDTDRGWDGTFKNTPQQSQTVVWILEGLGVDNVIYTKKGVSTLIR